MVGFCSQLGGRLDEGCGNKEWRCGYKVSYGRKID